MHNPFSVKNGWAAVSLTPSVLLLKRLQMGLITPTFMCNIFLAIFPVLFVFFEFLTTVIIAGQEKKNPVLHFHSIDVEMNFRILATENNLLILNCCTLDLITIE